MRTRVLATFSLLLAATAVAPPATYARTAMPVDLAGHPCAIEATREAGDGYRLVMRCDGLGSPGTPAAPFVAEARAERADGALRVCTTVTVAGRTYHRAADGVGCPTFAGLDADPIIETIVCLVHKEIHTLFVHNLGRWISIDHEGDVFVETLDGCCTVNELWWDCPVYIPADPEDGALYDF